MGAMAPPPHWIPEDDVLLKNAVEAGASLESLAKGAVQFSRRYTVQELQDRWYSLLYDPVVSEEASALMIEVERSAFTNQSRPNKSESVKEITCSSGKRKAESIRKCYYSMRKRICNEPFDMMGINLLSGPSNSNFGDGNELSSADCGIGNLVSNNLGIQGADFNIRHRPFSEFGPHAAESTGDGVTPSFNTGQNHGQDLHLGGNNVSHNLSYPYEENISLTGDQNEVPGFGQSKELSLCSLFEAEGLENEGNACSEFGGPPFHTFGCSSPLPQMPIWSTSADISATDLPIELGEKDQNTGEAFMIPQVGDANETEALRYSGARSNSNLKTSLSCDSMIDMTPSTEDYFAELSNTLFDFTNDDELLFVDTDGKETIDKSYFDGLSSLLLDSPNQSELPNVGLGEAAVATDEHFVGISGGHPAEVDNESSHVCYQHKVPEVQVASSASAVKGFGPEYRNGVICCTLNTEDPEIPSNDDVFLPFRFPSPSNSSGSHWGLHDPSYLVSSSVKDFSSTRKPNGGPPVMKNSQKDPCVPSRLIGSSQPSNMGLKYPIGDPGVKFELPKSSIQHAALRNARNSECSDHISSANIGANNFIGGGHKGGVMEMERRNNLDNKSIGACLDKHPHGPDILQGLQKRASGIRNGYDAKAETPNNGPSNADRSCQTTPVLKPIETSLPPDQEELWSEDDFDVPYFSDVEAMILDMDLSPDEFDLYTNPEVQRYQHEETKRTIIRLEQSAYACTQRTIAAQGALAVLCGRCSKHFIKKPEVLLGRGTEDIKVDIDLGREKHGGKISRRQAIIKMDMYGIFHLKNLGKCSIYVNGKEVATGQRLSLTSGCLIEVRGLAFVFETNHKRVKQYVDSIAEGTFLMEHKPNRS
ncbi:UNVERIFIED_CONTAM: Microspherule protein 1 [Sesamum angustifolium]|uniref:Microspherule protein 1 n=1 Tax=Sesamum angustifolium TaxID=2727405 RepID=A0AAW2L610_9LAMI